MTPENIIPIIKSGLSKNIPVLMFQNFFGPSKWEGFANEHDMHVMTITRYDKRRNNEYITVSTWRERHIVSVRLYDILGEILRFSVFYLE